MGFPYWKLIMARVKKTTGKPMEDEHDQTDGKGAKEPPHDRTGPGA
ncbi:hypothetical protein CGRA01v4_03011 [Colletotrichum graminicola]|nr:hypothetical protein CGRA01v4_03011 [Colletotrichum graminicola]